MRVPISILLLALTAFAPHQANAALTCTEFEFDAYDCIEDVATSRYEWEFVGGPGAGVFTLPDINIPNWAMLLCLEMFNPPANVGGILVQDVFTKTVKVFMPYVGSGLLHTANPKCRTQAPSPALVADNYYYWGGAYYWDYDFTGLYCSSMAWYNGCSYWNNPSYWYMLGWYY
jgi:hypothetical protein